MSAPRALAYKTLRVWVNQGRLLKRESRFKLLFITLVFTGLYGGVRGLFLSGFRFLDTLGSLSSFILNSLFALFFLGLGMMMVISGFVTAYSTYYEADEVPFLLTSPVPLRQLVIARTGEAIALSSWAFFFIILPFLHAFQRHQNLPAWFWLAALAFAIPFLVLTAGIGGLAALLLGRWIPRGRRVLQGVLILAASGGILFGFLFFREYRTAPSEEAFLLARLAPGVRLASRPWLPSWWVAEGLMAVARGMPGRGFMLWLLLASQAALVVHAIEVLGGLLFWEAWQRSAVSSSLRRRPILFARAEALLSPLLPSDLRALLFKDIRSFVRDPAQWGQSLIFFGLLALYFLNLRQFRYHLLPDLWRNLIAFLNLFSVASVLCSLSARFIYPQLSLEGHGFWILWLAPTHPRRILLAKFAFSAAAMSLISMILMGLSCAMLGVTPAIRNVAFAVGLAIPVALSALSIGLGAIFLDLQERNPAAIVSGFGGTLNLVCGLLFMMAAILPFAALFHLHTLGRMTDVSFHRSVLWAALSLLLLTAATIVAPLTYGLHVLQTRDF